MGSGTPGGQAELRQDEAVLLAHALVARLAEQVGARALFIKGPTAVAQGVRPPRGSSDVDVLVEPSAFPAMCAATESAGWQLRTPIGTLRYAGEFAFDHSAHYIHTEWPIDVDIHYSFPGFLAEPESVFGALWARRTTVEVAGRAVPTPDLLGQSLVVGLHALRDPEKPQSQEDLAHLAAALGDLGAADRDALRDLARDAGASRSGAEVLRLAGVEPYPLSPREAQRVTDWELRQQGHGIATAWLFELGRAPWRDRPVVLRRALFPPAEHFVASTSASGLTRAQLAGLRLRRWGRGVVGVPHALGVLLRRRRTRRPTV
ncbi:nucleotidyltransferase family protein [Phycicoccus sp. M110.8]|uniref:nucleotidyltransferase family protein n=1 Tax=Phycicoccus sp. M110.8 TaxID=3075433 RepID=UPI0028FD6C0D|nr:nucleotidyltransferase family protein [Phycicoccus sp. M110.8]MDU0314713.1 nucleotidyltransferase family protein [Phycicoccus sp. M110.8]